MDLHRHEPAAEIDPSSRALRAALAAVAAWDQVAVPLLLGGPLTAGQARQVTDLANRMRTLSEAVRALPPSP